MTDEQKKKLGQHLVYIDDDRWDKVTRRAFAMTEKGKARVTYSEVIRMALDMYFHVLELMKPSIEADSGNILAFVHQAIQEKLERDRP